MVQLSDRLGCARRQRQDWFAENDDVMNNVLIEENSLHRAWVDRSTDDNKADFYRDKGIAPLLSANSRTLLNEKTRTLQGSAEHFRRVLNRLCSISDAATARLPQAETNVDIDLLPFLYETSRPSNISPEGKRMDLTRFMLRSTTSVYELLSADDCAVNAIFEVEVQRSSYLFAAACDIFGLITNTEKTVVMHQPPPDAAFSAPQSNGSGTQLQSLTTLATCTEPSLATPK
nr:unnamed protein product [Spirometra erinaceieuropaei]